MEGVPVVMTSPGSLVWLRDGRGGGEAQKWPADHPYNTKLARQPKLLYPLTDEQMRLSLNELAELFPAEIKTTDE